MNLGDDGLNLSDEGLEYNLSKAHNLITDVMNLNQIDSRIAIYAMVLLIPDIMRQIYPENTIADRIDDVCSIMKDYYGFASDEGNQ